jgi:hypothetical protein
MTVVAGDIKAIIECGSRDVGPMLNDANVLVTEILGSSGLSQGRLDVITKYLAAHFVCLVEENGGITGEKVGSSENRYIGVPTTYKSVTRGLNITRYGQQALAFDTTGLLAAATANSGMKAQFKHIKSCTWLWP